MKTSVLLTLAAIVSAGCAHQHFTKGSGDAGQFILSQAVAHGARPICTNALPKVGVGWRYFQDDYGVVMRLSHKQFAAVESFLRQSFGEPSMPVTETTDRGKMGVYGVKAIGAGIQFGCDKKDTFVNILRPVPTKVMMEHLPKVLEEMEKGR